MRSDMDFQSLKDHVDARFDRLETKIDDALTTQSKHNSQIEHLQGFAKLAISVFVACAGFFALAYFSNN